MPATTELIDETTKPARLAELLPRWLELPVYRSRLDANGDIKPLTNFFDLPFITKQHIRDGFPHNFLSNGPALETLLANAQAELEHTSGTSEERTPVLFGRGWWPVQEMRALRLNRRITHVLDEYPNARRAVLTTPICNGTACHSRWTPRSARIYDDSLFVNQTRIPFLLEDAELARMAEEIGEWSPQFLDLDPVHGAWFALYCERKGIRFPSLQFVLCSYEFVSVVHRRILERVFGVPAFNLYGSTETGHLLMEDEHGVTQPSLETAFLEVVSADRGGVGDLVVTTLSNDYMPLLRYRIGDLVEQCGNNYIVHGRARDALRTPDDRRVTTWQVDNCFAGANGIAHYQLRQTESGDCVLRYVQDGNGPSAQNLRELISRLENVLHSPGRIVAEASDLLVPAPSGKYRLTCRD
ncbi:MAG TPA: hypothetical protein VF437_10470 [Verrucomicrobiae bacterium]